MRKSDDKNDYKSYNMWNKEGLHFEKFDYSMGAIFLYILFYWLGMGNYICFIAERKVY